MQIGGRCASRASLEVQPCRVLRVDDTPDGDFAMAFEFATRNPKFWPVVFPPED